MHAPYVTEISLPRPDDLGGGQWVVSNLTSIFVVFGRNGSGKSRLLRVWRDTAPEQIHYVVPERAGTLEFEAGYLRQELSGEERRRQTPGNYLNEYRQRVVTRVQAYFAARGNVRDTALPGNPADLETLLNQLAPDFSIELDGLVSPPYRLRRARDNNKVSGIEHLSSGEAQLLTLGLDLLTLAAIWDIEKRTSRLILLDEPDAHIHPDLQARFADFLVQVAEKYELQIGIATHSTSLLAAIGQFAGPNAGVAYLNPSMVNVKVQPMNKVRRELSSILGGHALMGPLFGVPILLVEGDDDFRLWSQIPRYHQINLSVIPGGGEEIKQYQKALEQLFDSLVEPGSAPAGYALIDADKSKPSLASTPQAHIRYIRLECHETENLYLSDEILSALGINWDEAKAKIAAAGQGYGPQKALTLGALLNGDRKTADIKSVILQLEEILDPKRVHWTLRLAQVIGKGRPTGQLAEFLGSEVLLALWGPEPNLGN